MTTIKLNPEDDYSSSLHRVVRTDFYFDAHPEGLGWTSDGQGMMVSGISAAWMKHSAYSQAVLDEFRPIQINRLSREQLPQALANLSALLRYPDAAVRELTSTVDQFMADRNGQPSVEQRLALKVFDQSIIIEQSPPVAEVLSNPVHGATSTSLGILIGSSLAPNPYVMVVTIPLGIILMGTAMGISKGLERGLAKRVEKILNPPASRRKDR